jgi:type IX secretion system PorP/SprF family membrane protein
MNMNRYTPRAMAAAMLVAATLNGQETTSGLNYQVTMINNPSLAGGEGDGVVRLSYTANYPGNGFNLNTIYLSYDGFSPVLHGGAGIYISDNYLGGIINDLRGGITYSYHFRAGENLYIGAGLSGSFYHRGYNFRGASLPDQVDPLGGIIFPSGEHLAREGTTVFDVGAGLLFISGRVTGGLSVSHLTGPDPAPTDFTRPGLTRQLLLHVAGDIDIGKEKKIKMRPLGKIEARKGYFAAAAGMALEINNLSLSSVMLGDAAGNYDAQAGFSFNTGSMEVIYNYRFNLISGNKIHPFTVFHNVAINFIMNNVDKRKVIKTINFPNL